MNVRSPTLTHTFFDKNLLCTLSLSMCTEQNKNGKSPSNTNFPITFSSLILFFCLRCNSFNGIKPNDADRVHTYTPSSVCVFKKEIQY